MSIWYKYRKLFLSTFELSACTFGGGFVIIPLMRKKFVEELGWIEEEEMLDLTAIAQASPGAIAVNASIMLGYHIAGIPGAILAVLGTVLPPLIIISIISMFYQAFRNNVIVSMAMPIIQNQVIDIHHWLTMTQFTDIITIAEMTPGPIAINSASFVGIQVAGFCGAVIATVGCVFPSCIIVMVLAYMYYRYRGLDMVQGILSGLRPAVIAMIASAGISLLIMAFYGQSTLPNNLTSLDVVALIIFAIDIFILRKWKSNPLWVMLCSGIVGIVLYLLV